MKKIVFVLCLFALSACDDFSSQSRLSGTSWTLKWANYTYLTLAFVDDDTVVFTGDNIEPRREGKYSVSGTSLSFSEGFLYSSGTLTDNTLIVDVNNREASYWSPATHVYTKVN